MTAVTMRTGQGWRRELRVDRRRVAARAALQRDVSPRRAGEQHTRGALVGAELAPRSHPALAVASVYAPRSPATGVLHGVVRTPSKPGMCGNDLYRG
jgi:hypothetical protein